MTAVQLFPDNPTANLNAACIALIQKDKNRSRLSRKSSAITGNDAGQRCLMFPVRQL